MNYYNEHDPKAAAWLRQLIAWRLIPKGQVDERDIQDVQPSDLDGFTQCHFFAGIGGWSLALELAGWPADRPVWTGSCPCQPFSTAGQQRGANDERHLWPDFFRLIRERRPEFVFGEQVEGAIRHGWLDGVRADMETENYALGVCVLGAHGAGSPHIRQRLYWVANSNSALLQGESPARDKSLLRKSEGVGQRLEHAAGDGREQRGAESGGRGIASGCSDGAGGMADPNGEQAHAADARGLHAESGSGRRNGYWDAYDLIPCRDGKARRVEPGTFPLAHGFPSRVDLLRGYGNAIVPAVAAQFITAFEEACGGVSEIIR